jgi:hypothetical protein
MGNEAFARLKYKFLNNKLLPHHSFHVFNIFKRTGNLVANQTLTTMDNCRISFGQVANADSLLTRNIMVRTKPLEKMGEKLHLGRKTLRSLKVDYRGRIFLKELNVGDWVSFHWGFVCDLLSPKQVKSIEFYTEKAIDFYNV